MSTRELLRQAEAWANLAGTSLSFFIDYPGERHAIATLRDAQDRALLRCALDVLDLLRSAGDFRQAAHDLGLEPVGEDAERP